MENQPIDDQSFVMVEGIRPLAMSAAKRSERLGKVEEKKVEVPVTVESSLEPPKK